jgi:hypothetical protein
MLHPYDYCTLLHILLATFCMHIIHRELYLCIDIDIDINHVLRSDTACSVSVNSILDEWRNLWKEKIITEIIM